MKQKLPESLPVTTLGWDFDICEQPYHKNNSSSS